MCGICGMFDQTGKRPVNEEIINRMLAVTRHRGPDGSQSKIMPGVGLGFNRLSFIDLSGGMQPITNEDESLTLICNGEIFNYRELRAELKA